MPGRGGSRRATGTARAAPARKEATRAGARGRRPCGGGQPWARGAGGRARVSRGRGVLLARAIGCGGGDRRTAGQARDNSRLWTDGRIETAWFVFSGSEVAAMGLCRVPSPKELATSCT